MTVTGDALEAVNSTEQLAEVRVHIDEENIPPLVLFHETVPVVFPPVTLAVQVVGTSAGTGEGVHMTDVAEGAGAKAAEISAHPSLSEG